MPFGRDCMKLGLFLDSSSCWLGQLGYGKTLVALEEVKSAMKNLVNRKSPVPNSWLVTFDQHFSDLPDQTSQKKLFIPWITGIQGLSVIVMLLVHDKHICLE